AAVDPHRRRVAVGLARRFNAEVVVAGKTATHEEAAVGLRAKRREVVAVVKDRHLDRAVNRGMVRWREEDVPEDADSTRRAAVMMIPPISFVDEHLPGRAE